MKILVTGATGAIGREIVIALEREGVDVIAGCRSIRRGKAFSDELTDLGLPAPEILIIDLSDSISVNRAVSSLGEDIQINAVINNAGVMNHSFRMDNDGHENTLNVNYHNTRLLTELLIPRIARNGAIVFTTSATRHWFPFQKLRTDIKKSEFGQLKTYALSKKLITRYAASLVDNPEIRSRDIKVNCADPGVVDTPMLAMGRWYDRLTDILFRPFCLRPATAAQASIRAIKSGKSGYIFIAPRGKSRNRN